MGNIRAIKTVSALLNAYRAVRCEPMYPRERTMGMNGRRIAMNLNLFFGSIPLDLWLLANRIPMKKTISEKITNIYAMNVVEMRNINIE
jgi:hypothetical protein